MPRDQQKLLSMQSLVWSSGYVCGQLILPCSSGAHQCWHCDRGHTVNAQRFVSEVRTCALQVANAEAAQGALQVYCGVIRRWLLILDGYESQASLLFHNVCLAYYVVSQCLHGLQSFHSCTKPMPVQAHACDKLIGLSQWPLYAHLYSSTGWLALPPLAVQGMCMQEANGDFMMAFESTSQAAQFCLQVFILTAIIFWYVT